MINLTVKNYNLVFKRPAGTSRGVLKTKPSYFLMLHDSQNENKISIGECGILPGLSYDDKPGYEKKLEELKSVINSTQKVDIDLDLDKWPSIRFGLEILIKDYYSKSDKVLFPTAFTQGQYKIPINGLIWMGGRQFMFNQIKTKIDEGWSCIKMKIGAIDFKEELELLKFIRAQFKPSELELRVDANGAFAPRNALEKLKYLSDYSIHSIEQPIKAKQIDQMAELCEISPIPIALDEELIGIFDYSEKMEMIRKIKPQYIILKPSLIGGWKASEEWIQIAKENNVKYWATSALESNIGLNAIAQWTATLEKDLVHGLGTGQLYTNNFQSPLLASKGFLSYQKDKNWSIPL